MKRLVKRTVGALISRRRETNVKFFYQKPSAPKPTISILNGLHRDPINAQSCIGFFPFTAEHAQPRGAARWLAVVVSLTFILSCTAQAETIEVRVQEANPHFNPLFVDIQVGDTVRWVWNDNFAHSATSGDGNTGTPDGVFDSGIHSRPFTFSVTFQNAGSFPYFCRVHAAGNHSGVWPAVNVLAPAQTPATDFNGDGKPDYVLYKAGTQQTAVWYLNNNVYIGGAFTPTLPAGWIVVSTADFNRDGHPDYALFKPSTRQTVIWYFSGVTRIGSAYGPTPPSGWALVATGDFNNDEKPDYVLYKASTGQTVVWYLNNNVYIGGAVGPTLPAGWSVVGVADFNRDGKADYLLFKASTRQTVIWYLNNNVFIGGAVGPTLPAGWSVAGVADFNRDGKPDYLLFNASTRQTVIWYLNNNVRIGSAVAPTLPPGWTVAAP